MRDSDGSARAEAPPEASPSTSRQGRPTPTPRSPPSASKAPLACNPRAPPRSHLDARRAVQPPGPEPAPPPSARRRPRAGGTRVARRGLIHIQGAARRGGRQKGTKAVPPPAAPCQTLPPPRRPGGPRRGPPRVCSAGPGYAVLSASGRRRRRQPLLDPAHPTPACNPRGQGPLLRVFGAVEVALSPGASWTARGLRQRPEFWCTSPNSHLWPGVCG